MKSLKEQADPNCPTCKGTGQDTTTTGFTCVCDCVSEPSSGLKKKTDSLKYLGFKLDDQPEIKEYGVNPINISGPGLSIEVFQKRMGELITKMKEQGININFITEVPEPTPEAERAEIEREAEAWAEDQAERITDVKEYYTGKDLENGYINGIIAERSRLSSLLLHSEQKNKESVRLLELAGEENAKLKAGYIPCTCYCHKPGVPALHFVACCEDGWAKTDLFYFKEQLKFYTDRIKELETLIEKLFKNENYMKLPKEEKVIYWEDFKKRNNMI